MASFDQVLAAEVAKVQQLIAQARTDNPTKNIDHLWSRYFQLSSAGAGGAASSSAAPMLRVPVIGPKVNYFEAIAAPADGKKLCIYSISLKLEIPVRVSLLSGSLSDGLGPTWAEYIDAQVIEPPFSEGFELPAGEPFTIRVDNGEDGVGISGTIEYKEVD